MGTHEHRDSKRKTTYAKLTVKNLPGYIRNVSREGLGVEFFIEPEVQSGEELEIQILPEQESGLEPMASKVQVQWKKQEGPFYQLGLKAVEEDSQSLKVFATLLDLYG